MLPWRWTSGLIHIPHRFLWSILWFNFVWKYLIKGIWIWFAGLQFFSHWNLEPPINNFANRINSWKNNLKCICIRINFQFRVIFQALILFFHFRMTPSALQISEDQITRGYFKNTKFLYSEDAQWYEKLDSLIHQTHEYSFQ